mmetsp:Transcript_6778/g.9991  ORF Transcript_6778/g.9991 Transcript_6778/m.9991 type:complete len:275 (+) Transcript_6778:796-1620(+)
MNRPEYSSFEERRQALGEPVPGKERYFEESEFEGLEFPKPGDWLASHKERGQSFSQFQSEARVPLPPRNTIYIQPLGEIPSPMLKFIHSYCSAFFWGNPVEVLEPIRMENLQVASRVNVFRQYHAGGIIKKLKMPQRAFCVLAITFEDLYPRESWNFVFGLAKGNKGVFSFARLSFEGVQELLWFRAAKTCTHELSHMFGLKHCIYYLCLMNGSNSLEESSSKPNYLCPVCLKKLYYCIGFNLKTRYDMLARVCNKPFELLQNQMQFYETMANL